MPNLPEDIVDRIKNLERQVRQLTSYVNTRAAAPTRTAGAAADGGADESGRPEEERGEEERGKRAPGDAEE